MENKILEPPEIKVNPGTCSKCGLCTSNLITLMRYMGYTPPFRRYMGENLSGSIVEASYLQLGGIDQYVLINKCIRIINYKSIIIFNYNLR